MNKKLFVLLLILTVYQGFSQTITEWRGNNRQGIYPQSTVLDKWPEAGPALLWKNLNIGNGYGSPAVTADRIYITGEIDTIAWIFCLDKQGREIWKSPYGKEWVATFPGSRSTPTIAGDLLYVTSGLGNLACMETATGKPKWFIDMKKDLHGRFTMHGHSESPLVNGDLVYLVPGGMDTNVVALDRFTGKIVWISKGCGFRPAYNSPLLITLPERKIMVTFTAYALMGLDAATGELLFRHDQDNIPVEKRDVGMGDTHSNTVWYEDGFIYYFAGDGNGAVKLKLSNGGKKVEQVWRNPQIDNYMGGFIKMGDNLYSCLFEKKKLITVEAATGRVTDSLNVGRGNLISDGKLLYYYNLKGEMNLIKPGARPELVSTFRITEGTKEHFSHPVIDDGVLYIRHGKALMAYQIK